MTIQWFPGHMTKAKGNAGKFKTGRSGDRAARLPDSAVFQNPMLDEIIQTKPRLIVLSKRIKAKRKSPSSGSRS